MRAAFTRAYLAKSHVKIREWACELLLYLNLRVVVIYDMFDVQPFHLVVIIFRMPIDKKVVRDLLHGATDVSIQLLN